MELSLGTLTHRLHRLLRIDRRLAERNRPVELHQRRIFILPTRYGVLFFLLVFVMLIGATNYNNSGGFLLGFLLLAMALISILHTYRNLAGLTFRAGRCEPVFAGDRARYTIVIANPRALARCAVSVLAEGQASCHDIATRDETRVTIEAPAAHRGRRPLAPITVVSRYPLGLFRAWSNLVIEADCLVYPRPAREAPWPHGNGGTDGDRHASRSGNDDFLGWRDYQAGDAPSRIDWKVAARIDELHTKQFSATDGDLLWLDWDAFPGDDLEVRLGRMCRAVLDADDRGRRYGLRLPEQRIPPDTGPLHRHRCLEALALFGKAS